MKFRKKPVVVEAVQITDSTFDNDHPNDEHIVGVLYCPKERVAKIQTLEGEMTAQIGDWIITGVNGELYPCKPDIFEKTYEEAEVVRDPFCPECKRKTVDGIEEYMSSEIAELVKAPSDYGYDWDEEWVAIEIADDLSRCHSILGQYPASILEPYVEKVLSDLGR